MLSREAQIEIFAPYFVALHIRTSATLTGAMRDGDGSYSMFASACVFESNKKWVLATAGHVLQDIQNIKNAGHDVHLKLVDSIGRNKSEEAVPLLLTDSAVFIYDDGDADFGFLDLSELVVASLRTTSNPTKAIAENHWRHPARDDDFDSCYVIGMPGQLQKLTGATPDTSNYMACFSVLKLDHMFRVPDEIAKDGCVWYGRVALDKLPSKDFSLRGVSGGLVMGVHADSDEEGYVHAIGMQYAERRYCDHLYVYATPFYLVGRFLDCLAEDVERRGA